MAKKEAKEKVIKHEAEKLSSTGSESRPKKEAKPKKEKSIEETLWWKFHSFRPHLIAKN